MTQLTAIDIATLRKADFISVIYNDGLASYAPTGVNAVKEAKVTESDPFATQQRRIIDAPVFVRSYYQSEIAAHKVFAHAMVYLYHRQSSPESTAFMSLKIGDEISFEFRPDRHCNGYVAAAGLHADCLLMTVARKGKRLEFEIASGIAPNNSGRMVQGLPETDSYRHNGARTRRENWSPPAEIIEPATAE